MPTRETHRERIAKRRRLGIVLRHRNHRRRAHRAQALVAVVLARKNRKPAKRQRTEHRPLLVGYPVLRLEELYVRRADGADQSHVRPSDVHKVRDLARMVCAHLHDKEVGVRRTVEDGERQAEVVVEVARSRVHLESARPQEGRRQLLHRRLSCAASDSNDCGLQRPAVLARSRRQLFLAVYDSGRAGGFRLRNEIVPVHVLAIDGDEQHARLNLSRV